MDERLSTNACRTLLGETASQMGDEEMQALRDEVYELANVIVSAHLDLERRCEDLQLNGMDPDDEWRIAALGLSTEDLSLIEEELDIEYNAKIDEVWRDHESD